MFVQKIETFVTIEVKSVERSCVPSCVEQTVGDKVTKCCHDKDLCNVAAVVRAWSRVTVVMLTLGWMCIFTIL